MKSLTCVVASSAALLATVAEAGLIFQDIRPRSYKKERKLDIMAGNLYSPYTLTVHDMYYLNYCDSVKENYTYHDDNVDKEDVDDFEQGVTMWDTNLHESFFQVSQSAVMALIAKLFLTMANLFSLILGSIKLVSTN